MLGPAFVAPSEPMVAMTIGEQEARNYARLDYQTVADPALLRSKNSYDYLAAASTDEHCQSGIRCPRTGSPSRLAAADSVC